VCDTYEIPTRGPRAAWLRGADEPPCDAGCRTVTSMPGEQSVTPGMTDADTAAAPDENSPAGRQQARRRMLLATALTAVSGFADSIGYMELGRLYVSFMSGNSTRLGMMIAGADWSGALLAVTIIATFVAGSAAGTFIGDRAGRAGLARVLGAEWIIVACTVVLAWFGYDRAALIPIAGAMGMQNTLHQVVASADIGRGFLSGNLFSLGQSLARIRRGRDEIARAGLNGLSWLVFVGGVVAGTLSHATFGLQTALATLLVLVSGLIIAVRGHQS